MLLLPGSPQDALLRSVHLMTHEVSIAGTEDPQGPYLAGCRCGWMGELRPVWQLALADAKEHLEQAEEHAAASRAS